MTTITWKDVSSGYGGNENALVIGGSKMVSEGLGGARSLIGEMGAIAKDQELRKKDAIAQEYAYAQQDAEAELMEFLRINQSNPLISGNAINPTTGKLEFRDKKTYLSDQITTQLKLDPNNKDSFSVEDKKKVEAFAAEYDKFAADKEAGKDALSAEYDRLSGQLDSTRNLQKNMRAIYSTGNNWLNTADIETRAAAFSTGFGGTVDKEAALAEKTTQEKMLENELQFDLNEIQMKQEQLKNDKQRLTVDYDKFAEATKDGTLESITTNFREGIGKYADFADSVTKLALYKLQETGVDWEPGRAQELAHGAENAFSKLNKELDIQIKSQDPEIANKAAEKKAALAKYKNMLWVQALGSEKFSNNIIYSGGDLDKYFGLFGEGTADDVGDYFKTIIDTNLDKVVSNELTKRNFDSSISALEKDKAIKRNANLARLSQVDRSFRAELNRPTFRDLATKSR